MPSRAEVSTTSRTASMPGAMPLDARQMAQCRPASVAVHDDGDVRGQPARSPPAARALRPASLARTQPGAVRETYVCQSKANSDFTGSVPSWGNVRRASWRTRPRRETAPWPAPWARPARRSRGRQHFTSSRPAPAARARPRPACRPSPHHVAQEAVGAYLVGDEAAAVAAPSRRRPPSPTTPRREIGPRRRFGIAAGRLETPRSRASRRASPRPHPSRPRPASATARATHKRLSNGLSTSPFRIR